MKIVNDIRVNFYDQLGVLGTDFNVCFAYV